MTINKLETSFILTATLTTSSIALTKPGSESPMLVTAGATLPTEKVSGIIR